MLTIVNVQQLWISYSSSESNSVLYRSICNSLLGHPLRFAVHFLLISLQASQGFWAREPCHGESSVPFDQRFLLCIAAFCFRRLAEASIALVEEDREDDEQAQN